MRIAGVGANHRQPFRYFEKNAQSLLSVTPLAALDVCHNVERRILPRFTEDTATLVKNIPQQRIVFVRTNLIAKRVSKELRGDWNLEYFFHRNQFLE